jgi:inner membrane transporter RhtA
VVAALVVQDRLDATALLQGAAAGVLASAVPYAADLVALRYVPARTFGVFMSVHPVMAALAGTVLLEQVLAPHEWTGIVVVVLANAVAVAGPVEPPGRAPALATVTRTPACTSRGRRRSQPT